MPRVCFLGDECYENAKRQADACQAAGRMLQGHCEGTSGRHGQNIYWTLGCGVAQ